MASIEQTSVTSVDASERVTNVCGTLNNYLLETENASYVPSGFIDSVSESGNMIAGSWRTNTQNDSDGMQNLSGYRSNNDTTKVEETRENFKNFFNCLEG